MELGTGQMHRVAADKFIVNITFGWEHAVAITTNEDAGKLVSHRFPQFSFAAGMATRYFRYLILDEDFRYHLWLASPGGAGRNRVLKISEMLEYRFYFPSKEEQEKIAAFLTSLDSLITLHQRKYDRLVDIKKSLLDKMFPKNGETVPEVRFSGFTDAWEQRKLKDISLLITKGTTPLDKSGEGNINFVKIENIDPDSGEICITQRISQRAHETYLRRSQLKENDILFSIAGTLGRVTSVKSSIIPANTNQALAIVRLKKGLLNYVKTFLKGRAVTEFVRKNPTIGAQPNLSLEQVGSIEISLPCVEEQRQIGCMFHRLDSLITLHRHKLERLQNIKKACLEKMFV